MVDQLFVVLAVVTVIVWLVQEKWARPHMNACLDRSATEGRRITADELQREAIPDWSEWAMRALMLAWAGWLVLVFFYGGGDFAFILVLLTLFAGLVAGLDRWVFAKARGAFVQSQKIGAFLAAYAQEQRENLQNLFGREMLVAEYANSFFPVLLVVMLLRSFLFEPFQIPSSSMVPTLHIGDYILVNKFNYGLRLPVLGTKVLEIDEPKRGDVMVFFPPHLNVYYIKRVIGLPGDEVVYKNKRLFINGEDMTQTMLAQLPQPNPQWELAEENLTGVNHMIQKAMAIHRQEDFSIKVEPGHYWMMGDNRDNSSDSRVWGQVPEDHIVGQAVAIWMHWPGLTSLPSFSRVGKIH